MFEDSVLAAISGGCNGLVRRSKKEREGKGRGREEENRAPKSTK